MPKEADLEQRDREVLNLVGLARRAGRAVVGTRAVREAARTGALEHALVARDAGENARNRVLPLFQALGTSWSACGRAGALARAIGRNRAVVVGITEPGLADRIRALQDPACRDR